MAHQCLAHCSNPKLVSIIDGDITGQNYHYNAYRRVKLTANVSRAPQTVTNKAGKKFHIDLHEIKPEGFGGFQYLMIIINDKTRIIQTIPLRTKTAAETTPKLRALCEEIKLMLPADKYPKYWRMDGGTEFSKFNKWAELQGIQIELSPPHTHEPNGVAEVYGHYIIQTTCTMIIDSGLPGEMWPHAADTAIYIINCLTNPKTGKSPL